MRLLFNDKKDIEIGSSRIFVYNISHWLTQLGYDINLNDWDHYSNSDVVIFGKSVEAEDIKKAKLRNPELVCGVIHPSDLTIKKREVMDECDFFVVGNIVEKDYYYQYKDNVFTFPDLERFPIKIKKHENHEPIIFGYHGNFHHLTQFHPYLKPALEKLADEISVKLLVISDEERAVSWRLGRPNIEIEFIQWRLDGIQDQVLQCDIGLVTGLTPIGNGDKKIIFNLLKWKQGEVPAFENDYLIRFKNTTNLGRAFVFFQSGIPVISDFLPSNFHILANPSCGYLAHHTEGWLQALRQLSKSAERREEIARNALKAFQHYYNPLDWSKRLYRDIEAFWKKRRQESGGNR
jgi:glycosyltransferase involved in cell wall biosynthesis